ncbi:MAG: ABC transporter permease [Methylovirgula sp.]
MKFNRIAAVVERHVYEARHNLERVTDTLYWPVMDIIVWGFLTVFLAQHGHLRPGIISFLLGAAILWGMFRAFQRDLAVSFLTEIWSHNVIGLLATPLTVHEYLSGLLIINLLKAVVGTAAAVLVALVCYSYNFFPYLLALLPFILVLMIFGLAVGILVTGLIIRYSTKIQSFTWSITGLVMPFSCVFYPVTALPRPMRPFALALPTTQAFEGLRQVISGGGLSMARLGSGLALDGVYLLAAIAIFDWLFRAARDHGLLVKLE